jgi:hypothetical protein
MKMDLKNNKLDETLKGMLSTPKGKGVVAGMVLVIVLLLVLLVVTFAVPQPDDSASLLVNREVAKPLNGVGQGAGQNNQVQAPTGTPTTSTASGISPVNAGSTVETESVKYSDEIMKFRDPFSPIIESTTTGGAGYTASSLDTQVSSTQASTNGAVVINQPAGGSVNVDTPSDGSDSGVDNGNTTSGGTDISQNIVLTAITREHGIIYGVFQYNGVEYKTQAGEKIGSSPYQVLDVGDGSATLLYGDDRLTIALGEEIAK